MTSYTTGHILVISGRELFLMGHILVVQVRKCRDKVRGYKTFLCSTQLSMKFQILINIKISRNSAFLGSDKPIML